MRADRWPEWFERAREVRFEAGGPALEPGAIVRWHMLGASIRVKVRRAEAAREIDWEGGSFGVRAYHAWRLEALDGRRTRVVTEETDRGPVPWMLRWYLRGALHRAHADWLSALAKTVTRGAPQ